MKNSLQPYSVRYHPNWTSVVMMALSTVMLGVGCRQPAGGSQFGKTGPFDSGNSSYVGSQPAGGAPSSQQYAALTGELQQLNQRLGAFDSDNQSLNTEVASLQQKLQFANQYNQTLKMQLSDTSTRIRQSEMETQSALQQLAASQSRYQDLEKRGLSGQGLTGQQVAFGGSQVPTQFAGGATIRANNSLAQRISSIQIPGAQVRMDGDLIRIEIPTDRLFVPGSYRIQPAQLPLLQNIAATLRRDFPKQRIGIEAHWDNTPLNPPTTTHQQLTATQALSVYDDLVRLGVPASQMFTTAMAGNIPRYAQGVSNGISANRRIELVIYPETSGGG